MISLVAVFLFIYILYRTFTDGIQVTSNYWESREFFSLDTDPAVSSSLEWTQTSPPHFHTYEELPYLVSSK
jgi:heme/copper-type cytochrome/quinol oxidase subunit 1